MTFVVLPILPDKAIDMWNLINPHQIWLMVVLVAGISFFGYIAVRFFGTKHGIGITGLLGGLVSSTAVTISMSKKAIDNSSLSKNLAVAITLASSVMLFRAWIEIFLIHRELAYTMTWAVIIATLSGYSVIAYLFFTANTQEIEQSVTFKNPFEINEALLMGLIFGVVLAFIGIAEKNIGDAGIYIVSSVSGLADVDAVILSLSSYAKNGLDAHIALNGIMIAIISNSFIKFSIALFVGKWALARYVAIYYLVTIPIFCFMVLWLN